VSSTVSQREEFVRLARAEGANVRALVRAFCISSATAYKWLARVEAGGVAALSDRSRRPHASPSRTPDEVERHVLALRDAHPAWGGRKLRHRLLALGLDSVPSASTITEILRRHDRLDPDTAAKHTPFVRFEHPEPNDLWQMDFKGEWRVAAGFCYPLTILDDHSRFALCLRACPNQRTPTTREAVRETFRRYGLPKRMTMDNGAPWAVYSYGRRHWTALTAWLVRLGIHVSHSRPHHPQTQGKDERFHRTLNDELVGRERHERLCDWQRAFDAWREVYNRERPHEALAMGVPSARYGPSARVYPERLEPIEYAEGDIVRVVQRRGQIKYQTRRYFVGQAFAGEPVALRPTTLDGRFDVYYCHQRVATIDLRVVWSD
jgi:transposase InsO family protein